MIAAIKRHTLSTSTACAVMAACLLSGCGTVQTTATVSVSGQRVAYALAGQTMPTVVFQAGLGDGKRTWASVLPAIERGSQVFAYDRPGYGGSASMSGKRDPCTIATEERSILQAAGIRPPYVLVGHSIGGLYQYVFAKLYPGEVAGLVLIDPTHPDQWKTMLREVPKTATVLKTVGRAIFNSTEQREFDDQDACLERIDMARSLDVPARVLLSTEISPLASPEFETMARRLFQDWGRLLGTSQLKSVTGSGHYIQEERPQAVIDAVRAVAAVARSK